MSTNSRSGHITWGAWVFDFRVTDYEGLALSNVFFSGKKMIHKISLPVIRVKYVVDGTGWTDFTQNGKGCGPYNDVIRWDPYTVGDFFEDWTPWTQDHHLEKISNCSNKYVCIKDIDNGNTLEIGIYARIGKYHLYQCYYLNNTGRIFPRVWSKGLSCNLNHRHHPYWRIDADVDGASPNRINQVTSSGTAHYISEGWVTRSNNMRWNFENMNTHAKLWIEPSATDEARDSFSTIDGYVRKYRSGEDRAWWREPHQEIAFNGQGGLTDNDDKVFWYVAHLSHEASEGEDHWGAVGPTVRVELPPNSFGANANRRIRVFGSMVTTDDEDWGSDEHATTNFDDFGFIDPSQVAKIFSYVQKMGGEIRVELKITAVWFATHAVVTVDAKLFEGTSVNTNDLDASRIVNVNVNHGGSNVVAFRLLNSEWNSPDKSDIRVTITNTQA
jgi:hypothetical protein